MSFDRQALYSLGVDLSPSASLALVGDVQLEGPTFCHAAVRFDTFIRVGAFCNINAGSQIGHTACGRFVSIAQNCFIGADKHPSNWLSSSRVFYVDNFREFGRAFPDGRLSCRPFNDTGAPVEIGHDVLITNQCIISRGVKIGHGAILAPGSIVTKDVEPYAIVGGNPARMIKKRFSDDVVERLLRSEWWNYNPFFFKDLDFSKINVFLEQFEERKSSLLTFAPKVVDAKLLRTFWT